MAVAQIRLNSLTVRAKGDQDPSEWMPPNDAAHCDYVKSWINVRYVHDLTITSTEETGLQDTLGTDC